MILLKKDHFIIKILNIYIVSFLVSCASTEHLSQGFEDTITKRTAQIPTQMAPIKKKEGVLFSALGVARTISDSRSSSIKDLYTQLSLYTGVEISHDYIGTTKTSDLNENYDSVDIAKQEFEAYLDQLEINKWDTAQDENGNYTTILNATISNSSLAQIRAESDLHHQAKISQQFIEIEGHAEYRLKKGDDKSASRQLALNLAYADAYSQYSRRIDASVETSFKTKSGKVLTNSTTISSKSNIPPYELLHSAVDLKDEDYFEAKVKLRFHSRVD